MTHDQEPVDPQTKARVAAAAADSKKGDDIVVLDVGDIMGIVDAFVITSAPNTRLVRTIADEIEARVAEQCHSKPRSVEGRDTATWILMDYGDVVVHVFLAETREFYGLERLWSDAPRLGIEAAS